MAYIKVELDYQIEDGMTLTFKAPCDCHEINGLKVYYKIITDSQSTPVSKTFTFKDTHGTNLSSIGNLFLSGTYVSVILDVVGGFAYIQNSDTNGYLETKFTDNQTKVYSNVNVPNSLWSANNTYVDYPYKADIPINGVTESKLARVVFDVQQAMSGSFAPVCNTGNGYVRIYADSAQSTFVIPTIAVEVTCA